MNLSTNNSRPTVLHHLNARDIVLVLSFLLLQIYPYHGMRFVSKISTGSANNTISWTYLPKKLVVTGNCHYYLSL